MKILNYVVAIMAIFLLGSCNSGDDQPNNNTGGNSLDFNRKTMLTHWADNIIIPAYTNYENKLDILSESVKNLQADVNTTNLEKAQAALTEAYIAWEKCNFFEVGPANNVKLRLYTNTYPTNANLIKELAMEDDYKLELPSNASKQGLPAIDYLLNGLENNNQGIVDTYKTAEGAKYLAFLNAVTKSLEERTEKVLNTWKGEYRSSFINNDGSSSTSSVDLIANDYLLYYEKYLRNGKVQFPVGVSNNNPSPEKVEAYYSPNLGKVLLKTSVEAMRDFYEGKSFDGSNNGLGFKDYLIQLKKENVTNKLDTNFDNILTKINALGPVLAEDVVNNRTQVLELHDAIQHNVKTLKVDMLQAMNITVAYFDGDGD